MITLEFRGLKRLTDDLNKAKKSAFPHAARNALNHAAFEARKLWQGEMRERLVLRNTWTSRTLAVVKASGTNMHTMHSVVGSPHDYMAKQEHGGTQLGSVPTGVSSGEGRNAPPRRKLVRQPNKLGAISLGQRYRRGSRKQRNAVALHMAAATGKKFVFLDLGRRKGLFRVSGGKRITQVDMVWNTSRKSHAVKAHPTLGPALQRLEHRLPNIMTTALLEQLKRHHVFGY